MTVKVYEKNEKTRGNWLINFLTRQRVQYEVLNANELAPSPAYLSRLHVDTAVEVDGRLFVNPNEDALRKILQVN